MGYYGYYNPAGSVITVLIVCFFVSLIAAIVLMAAFLPKSKQYRYNGFAKSLYHFFNFNTYWISPIIKILYMTVAFTCVIGGLITLFMQPLLGIGLMLFGVIVRIFYEMGYILYAIFDQLSQLNRKVVPGSTLNACDMPAQAAPIQAARTCAQCGSEAGAGDAFCYRCGSKL